MRALVAGLLLLAACSANAQVPNGNLFIGYSYLNVDNNSAFKRSSFNGWEASAEGKVLPFIGIVGDFSGFYGKETISTVCPGFPGPGGGCIPTTVTRTFNALVGPRLSVSVKGARPFAHALFGVSQTNPGGSNTTSFATAVGGGVDFRVIRFVAWRVQADLLRTSFFRTSQIDARVSTGLVFRF